MPIRCWCFLHGRGGDEDQLVRAMPALSWRNYVGLGLRGPELVTKRDRLVGFGWGREFEHSGSSADAASRRPGSEAEIVRASCMTPSPNHSTAWKRLCSRRSSRRAGCCTCTRSGSFWSAAAKGPRSPTGWV